MNVVWRVLLFGLILGLLVAPAYGFNSERKGFVLGVGAGTHNSTIDTSIVVNSYTGVEAATEVDFDGLATSFRLGVGVTDQFILHYSNEVNWISVENEDGWTDMIAVGVTGAGLTYYVLPTPKSLYATAVVGVGYLINLSDPEVDAYTGLGAQIGIGYEFAKWASVQFDLGKANLESNDFPGHKKEISFLKLSLQFNFY